MYSDKKYINAEESSRSSDKSPTASASDTVLMQGMREKVEPFLRELVANNDFYVSIPVSDLDPSLIRKAAKGSYFSASGLSPISSEIATEDQLKNGKPTLAMNDPDIYSNYSTKEFEVRDVIQEIPYRGTLVSASPTNAKYNYQTIDVCIPPEMWGKIGKGGKFYLVNYDIDPFLSRYKNPNNSMYDTLKESFMHFLGGKSFNSINSKKNYRGYLMRLSGDQISDNSSIKFKLNKAELLNSARLTVGNDRNNQSNESAVPTWVRNPKIESIPGVSSGDYRYLRVLYDLIVNHDITPSMSTNTIMDKVREAGKEVFPEYYDTQNSYYFGLNFGDHVNTGSVSNTILPSYSAKEADEESDEWVRLWKDILGRPS